MEDKLLVTMTADELKTVILDITKELTAEIVEAIKESAPGEEIGATADIPPYVVGYEALASLWGITARTAKKRVDSGVLDGAVRKECGVIIADAPLALKMWSEYVKKKKARR